MRQRVCFLLALALIVVLPSRSFSQKHPEIFSVADVVLGAQRLDTLYLHAAGAWSDADEIKNALSVEIECFKRIAYCAVAEPVVAGAGPASVGVALDGYDILRWNDQEMVAVDNTPICAVNTIRADFVAKTVTISSAKKATKLADESPLCKYDDLNNTAVLVNHEEVVKRMLQKAKQKKP